MILHVLLNNIELLKQNFNCLILCDKVKQEVQQFRQIVLEVRDFKTFFKGLNDMNQQLCVGLF